MPEGRGGTRDGGRARAATLVHALLIVVILVALGWVVNRPALQGPAQDQVAPVIVQASAAQTDMTVPATVEVSLTEPRSLTAPVWEGLVTAVGVGAGDAVVEGQVLFTVDGIDRVGAATPTPLYRVLEAGDSGDDVTALAGFLNRQGLLAADDADTDTVTAEFATALTEFRDSIGLSSAHEGPLFDPAWVVWMPDERPGQAAVVMVQPGASAPGLGTELVQFSPAVVEARLAADVTGVLTPGQDGDAVVLVPGVSAELRVQDGLLVVDDGQAAALGRRAAAVPGSGGDQQLDPEAAEEVDGGSRTVRLEATVRFTSPGSDVRGVPVPALVSTLAGQPCVVVEDGDSWQPRRVTVLLSSTATSTAMVRGLGGGDVRLVANPATAGLTGICE